MPQWLLLELVQWQLLLQTLEDVQQQAGCSPFPGQLALKRKWEPENA